MKDGLIGIFDSGVGGLSVWREVTRLVPQAATLCLDEVKAAREPALRWEPKP